MKKICFINGKGGTGKSASATTLAHILAVHKEKRVLLVDMDPQSNSSTTYSDVDFFKVFMQIYAGEMEDEKRYTVEDLLMDSCLDPRQCIIHTEYENLDVIPSLLTLSEAEERMKADTRTIQQFKLKCQLKKLEDAYDFCLIDCGPSVSLLNINALAAADEVYIPARTDGYSLLGIAISMNLIRTVQTYNPMLSVGGIFFTQYGKNKNVAKTAKQIMETYFPEELLPIHIGVTKNLEENSFVQKPLLEIDRNSKAAKAYLDLADYILAPNKKNFLKEYMERK